MNGSTPTPSNGSSTPPRTQTLEESVTALRELHGQLQVLNARLEYLRLMLKVGVR